MQPLNERRGLKVYGERVSVGKRWLPSNMLNRKRRKAVAKFCADGHLLLLCAVEGCLTLPEILPMFLCCYVDIDVSFLFFDLPSIFNARSCSEEKEEIMSPEKGGKRMPAHLMRLN